MHHVIDGFAQIAQSRLTSTREYAEAQAQLKSITLEEALKGFNNSEFQLKYVETEKSTKLTKSTLKSFKKLLQQEIKTQELPGRIFVLPLDEGDSYKDGDLRYFYDNQDRMYSTWETDTDGVKKVKTYVKVSINGHDKAIEWRDLRNHLESEGRGEVADFLNQKKWTLSSQNGLNVFDIQDTKSIEDIKKANTDYKQNRNKWRLINRFNAYIDSKRNKEDGSLSPWFKFLNTFVPFLAAALIILPIGAGIVEAFVGVYFSNGRLPSHLQPIYGAVAAISNITLLVFAFKNALGQLRHGIQGLTYDPRTKLMPKLSSGRKFLLTIQLVLAIAGIAGYFLIAMSSGLAVLDLFGLTVTLRSPILWIVTPMSNLVMGMLFFVNYNEKLPLLMKIKDVLKNLFLKYTDTDGETKFLFSSKSQANMATIFSVLVWNSIWATLKVATVVTVFWGFSVLLSDCANTAIGTMMGKHMVGANAPDASFLIPGSFNSGFGTHANLMGIVASFGETFFFAMAIFKVLDCLKYSIEVFPAFCITASKEGLSQACEKHYVSALRNNIGVPVKYFLAASVIGGINLLGFMFGMAGSLKHVWFIAATVVIPYLPGAIGSFGANTPDVATVFKKISDWVRSVTSWREDLLKKMIKDPSTKEQAAASSSAASVTSSVTSPNKFSLNFVHGLSDHDRSTDSSIAKDCFEVRRSDAALTA